MVFVNHHWRDDWENDVEVSIMIACRDGVEPTDGLLLLFWGEGN